MITLKNINKSFSHKHVLDDICLHITHGEVVCLLGRSGSGKSTLLRIIAGLIKPDSGCIEIDRSKTAMVFQEPRLLPWLTVEENLRLALPWWQKSHKKKSQIADVLKEVQLSQCEMLMPRELSGGMAQRVGVARALLRQPKTLLLDEPFSSLDALTRKDLQISFKELILYHKKTCVFVTHDIDEALFLGDRLLVLQEGRFCIESIVSKEEEKIEVKKHILQHLDKEL